MILLYSMKKDSPTESLEREVWKVEKSQLEYRKVPETCSSTAIKVSHYCFSNCYPLPTNLQSLLESDIQTNHIKLNSLDLKMKKRTGKTIRNIPGELSISKDQHSGTAYTFALCPKYVFPFQFNSTLYCIISVFIIRNLWYWISTSKNENASGNVKKLAA